MLHRREPNPSALRELEAELCSNTISRRDFLGRATVLGVAAATATSLWSAAAT